MSTMTLSNRNNKFDDFISTYIRQGFAQSSLGELFHDLQPDEDIGHLRVMMKSVFFENKDRIQKPRFYIQCTQGSILKDNLFHIKQVEDRVLLFFKEERCFADNEYPFIEQMVQNLHARNNIHILEFMGYKKAKNKCTPVLLGVCIFGTSDTSGCCIFYLAGKC